MGCWSQCWQVLLNFNRTPELTQHKTPSGKIGYYVWHLSSNLICSGYGIVLQNFQAEVSKKGTLAGFRWFGARFPFATQETLRHPENTDGPQAYLQDKLINIDKLLFHKQIQYRSSHSPDSKELFMVEFQLRSNGALSGFHGTQVWWYGRMPASTLWVPWAENCCMEISASSLISS